MKKTGQRKRKQMAVIKITKQGSEQKVEEKANNKAKEGPKTRAKRGKNEGKLGHTRAVQNEENGW